MSTQASSWVYLFSKFTNEAIAIELFFIFIFTFGYVTYWFIKRRREDDALIPAGVVKNYLNALIADAEQIRAQLFGLLGTNDPKAAQALLQNLNASGATDTQALLKTISISPSASSATSSSPTNMSEVEKKLAEQAKALEMLVAEKTRLETELTAARASKAGAGSSGGADSGEIAKLQQKIETLEGRLSEYSVIEDDLANLKRLQQENTQLKAQLAGKGAPAPSAPTPSADAPSAQTSPEPAPAAAAPTVTVTPVETKPAAEAAPAPEAASPQVTTAPQTQAPATTETSPLNAMDNMSAMGTTGEPAFEGLVDQVEASLQDVNAATPPPLPAAESSEASTSPAPAATLEKSDADLVAEFEKMLSG